MATDDTLEFVGEEIKFVWVDEHGNQVSPQHAKFRSALNYIAHWLTYWARTAQDQTHYGRHPVRPETKTGEPPVKLRRIVIRTYLTEITPEQQTVLDAHTETQEES